MKVSSINCQQYMLNKTPNFKGVWGETVKYKPDYDPVIATTQTTHVAYYFPFIDESKSHIDQIVKDNTSSEIVKTPEGTRQLLIKNCKVCAPLPIKQVHYDSYMLLENLSGFNGNARTTHVSVKDKFVNSGFQSGGVQYPAINKNVNEALIKKKMEAMKK